MIIITGATSGIGLETARALSATGATLFLTARNMEKAKTVLVGVLEPGRVSLIEMDVASFASIRAAAATILETSKESNQHPHQQRGCDGNSGSPADGGWP